MMRAAGPTPAQHFDWQIIAAQVADVYRLSNPVKLLFLDQTAELGGAELSLFSEVTNLPHSIVRYYYLRTVHSGRCLSIGRRERGESFRPPLGAMTRASRSRDYADGFIRFARGPAARAKRSPSSAKAYDIIYANSQKAFVVGDLRSGYLRGGHWFGDCATFLSAPIILVRRFGGSWYMLANWKAPRV